MEILWSKVRDDMKLKAEDATFDSEKRRLDVFELGHDKISYADSSYQANQYSFAILKSLKEIQDFKYFGIAFEGDLDVLQLFLRTKGKCHCYVFQLNKILIDTKVPIHFNKLLSYPKVVFVGLNVEEKIVAVLKRFGFGNDVIDSCKYVEILNTVKYRRFLAAGDRETLDWLRSIQGCESRNSSEEEFGCVDLRGCFASARLDATIDTASKFKTGNCDWTCTQKKKDAPLFHRMTTLKLAYAAAKAAISLICLEEVCSDAGVDQGDFIQICRTDPQVGNPRPFLTCTLITKHEEIIDQGLQERESARFIRSKYESFLQAEKKRREEVKNNYDKLKLSWHQEHRLGTPSLSDWNESGEGKSLGTKRSLERGETIENSIPKKTLSYFEPRRVPYESSLIAEIELHLCNRDQLADDLMKRATVESLPLIIKTLSRKQPGEKLRSHFLHILSHLRREGSSLKTLAVSREMVKQIPLIEKEDFVWCLIHSYAVHSRYLSAAILLDCFDINPMIVLDFFLWPDTRVSKLTKFFNVMSEEKAQEILNFVSNLFNKSNIDIRDSFKKLVIFPDHYLEKRKNSTTFSKPRIAAFVKKFRRHFGSVHFDEMTQPDLTKTIDLLTQEFANGKVEYSDLISLLECEESPFALKDITDRLSTNFSPFLKKNFPAKHDMSTDETVSPMRESCSCLGKLYHSDSLQKIYVEDGASHKLFRRVLRGMGSSVALCCHLTPSLAFEEGELDMIILRTEEEIIFLPTKEKRWFASAIADLRKVFPSKIVFVFDSEFTKGILKEFLYWDLNVTDMQDIYPKQGTPLNMDDFSQDLFGVDFCPRAQLFSATKRCPSNEALVHAGWRASIIFLTGKKYFCS